MNKVLIAIEREKFLFLYKYNSCHVAYRNILEISASLLQEDTEPFDDSTISALEKSLPIFETEMNILLLEYSKEHLSLNSGIELSFSGVQNIIPLSNEAAQKISSRLPEKMRIGKPISGKILTRVKSLRQHNQRKKTISSLSQIFNLTMPADGGTFINRVSAGLNKIQHQPNSVNRTSVIYNLISFDITPSFIPEGNIESIIKLGCIVYQSKESDIEQIKRGPFFQACKKHETELNNGSILKGYLAYKNMKNKLSENEISSIRTMETQLSQEFKYMNSVLVYYIYLSLNRLIAKREFDLGYVRKDIIELKEYDSDSLFYALAIFASVHSFDRLYESIHHLSSAPLFNSNKLNKPEIKTKLSSNTYSDQNTPSETASEEIGGKGDSSIKVKEPKQEYPPGIKSGKKAQSPQHTAKLDFGEEPSEARAHNIEDNETPGSTTEADSLIERMTKLLELKKGDSQLWEHLKREIRDLKEVNLGAVASLLRSNKFTTKTGKQNAAAKRFEKALFKCFNS